MKITLHRSLFNRLQTLSCSIAIATSPILLSANRAQAALFRTYLEPDKQSFQLRLPDLQNTLYSQGGLATILEEVAPVDPFFNPHEITTAIVPVLPQSLNYSHLSASALGTGSHPHPDISLPLFHPPLTCSISPALSSQNAPELSPTEAEATPTDQVDEAANKHHLAQLDTAKLTTENWNFNEANNAMTSAFENYISSLSASGIAWQF